LASLRAETCDMLTIALTPASMADWANWAVVWTRPGRIDEVGPIHAFQSFPDSIEIQKVADNDLRLPLAKRFGALVLAMHEGPDVPPLSRSCAAAAPPVAPVAPVMRNFISAISLTQ
jgi:hypothetical protein